MIVNFWRSRKIKNMRIIFGGHWNSIPNGWISIPEVKQDITTRLKYADNSIDAIFTEHVIEHISLKHAIFFMQESCRVLKPGGIFRVVAPMIDKLIAFQNDEKGQRYAKGSLLSYYEKEDQALRGIGLSGIFEDPHTFMMDSLLKKHNHQFVWSTSLMAKALVNIGFAEVNITDPGYSKYDNDTVLERIVRGTDPVSLLKDLNVTHYDPESGVVEARK